MSNLSVSQQGASDTKMADCNRTLGHAVVDATMSPTATAIAEAAGGGGVDSFDKYVTPLWYVIGLPGNMAAYIVWMQPRLRHSSGCYLAALALNDFCFLLLHIFFELQTKWDVTLLQLPVLCETFPIIFLATQYLSTLLVLGFTVERYIAICHPFQREIYCTTRRALSTIACLVLVSLGLHSVQGYFWKFYPPTSSAAADGEDCQSRDLSQTTGQCKLRPELTEAGMASVWSVWTWITELMVFGAVPLAILVLNVFVVAETRRVSVAEAYLRPLSVRPQPPTTRTRFPSIVASLSRQQTVQHSSSSSGGGSSNNPSAATITLLAVSFYLIATTLPVTFCYVLYLAFPEGDPLLPVAEQSYDPVWSRHFAYLAVRRIIEELAMSKYACNFYIYLTTGSTFRRELCRLIQKLPLGRSCRNLDTVVGGANVAVSGTRTHYADARLMGGKMSAL